MSKIYILNLIKNNKNKMKNKKIEKPDFIIRTKEGISFLEVNIPKEKEKEIKEKVSNISGAILCT